MPGPVCRSLGTFPHVSESAGHVSQVFWIPNPWSYFLHWIIVTVHVKVPKRSLSLASTVSLLCTLPWNCSPRIQGFLGGNATWGGQVLLGKWVLPTPSSQLPAGNAGEGWDGMKLCFLLGLKCHLILFIGLRTSLPFSFLLWASGTY